MFRRVKKENVVSNSMTTFLQTLSDQQLLQQATAGDQPSFEQLFQRHYDRIYGLLFRLVGNRAEAEDLTQEVFVRLYQRPPTATGREHNLKAWLYEVATNLGYNALRGRRRQWQRDSWLLPEENESNDPLQQVVQKEAVAQVRLTLGRLPERQVQLLLLRQMGLSYAELAEACHLNPTSVGTLLARAAQAFKEAFNEVQQEGILEHKTSQETKP